MNNKLIKLADYIVNSLPLIGSALALSALAIPSFATILIISAINIHFLNEYVKAHKEKNKWNDNVAFMEYMLKAAGYNLKE